MTQERTIQQIAAKIKEMSEKTRKLKVATQDAARRGDKKKGKELLEEAKSIMKKTTELTREMDAKIKPFMDDKNAPQGVKQQINEALSKLDKMFKDEGLE